MKRIISLVTAIVMVMAIFTGCTEKSETKPEDTTAGNTTSVEKKPVNMQFSIWGNDAHKKMYEELLAKYKEKNPHVSTEVLVIPFNDYQQKISIMKAGGQAPDISWLADIMVAQFMATNQLVDISNVSSDSEYDFNDINATALEPVKKDGKLYGIAFSTPPTLVYYNKNIFKEKGVQTPMELYKAGKWNFDELLKTAKAITDKEKGTYGLQIAAGDWKGWYFNVVDLVWGFGGDVFSQDGSKFTLNTLEGEQGVQMFTDMIFKDEVHPKPGVQTTFESGKIGMFSTSLSYVSTAKNIKDFEWDIAPYPSGPKGTNTRAGFAAYAMFKVDADPKAEEKLALFKYLTGKEAMQVTSQYFVPSRKSVLASDDFKKLYPANIQDSLQATVIDRLPTAKIAVTPANFAKINTEAQVFFDLLYTQTVTVKEMLAKMDEKINPLMK